MPIPPADEDIVLRAVTKAHWDFAAEHALTESERKAIRLASELYNELVSIIADPYGYPGDIGERDLGEMVIHIHAIQRAIMSNAAARIYPDLYRQLGETLESQPTWK